MLRSIKHVYGYQIRETDDVMGTVKDFYFDDESWTVRYLVVDLGGLFPGRHVFISPEALGRPDWETMSFPGFAHAAASEVQPRHRYRRPGVTAARD